MHILTFLWELLKQYWLDGVLVGGAIAGLIILIKKGQTDKVKKWAFYFVERSETKFNQGQGMAKLTHAILAIKNKSVLIRVLFTDEEIEEYVEEAVFQLFNYAKEKLEDA